MNKTFLILLMILSLMILQTDSTTTVTNNPLTIRVWHACTGEMMVLANTDHWEFASDMGYARKCEDETKGY